MTDGKRWKIWFAIVTLVALLAAAGGSAAYLRRQLAPADPRGEDQPFIIERGTGLGQVAQRLESQGLIRSARVFTALARYRDQAGAIHAGEYLVAPSLTTQEVLEQLVTGRVRHYEVIIPEGLRSTEIAARLEAAEIVRAEDFLAAIADPALAKELGVPANHLEGYLFPDTYNLPRGVGAEGVARVMVGQFQRVWDQLGAELPTRDPELNLHDLVTLASIVEKETGAADERPLIASVFLNRLRRNMRLETDPTVIFGIPDFDGNLRRVHLEDRTNPYNTYRIRGLPPGPIASPGAAALRSVLEPATSEYLFFVARGDGTHEFSIRYADHNRAVDRYQRRRRR